MRPNVHCSFYIDYCSIQRSPEVLAAAALMAQFSLVLGVIPGEPHLELAIPPLPKIL